MFVYTSNVSIYSFNQLQYLTAYDFPRRYKISVVTFVSITFQAPPPRNHGCLEPRLPLGFPGDVWNHSLNHSLLAELAMESPNFWEWNAVLWAPFLQCFVTFFDSLCLFILITFSFGWSEPPTSIRDVRSGASGGKQEYWSATLGMYSRIMN